MGLNDFSACQNKEVVGEAITVTLKKEAELGRRVTRHWLKAEGRRISADVSVGDVIAAELTAESEIYMLGIVIRPQFTMLENVTVREMGEVRIDDEVLEVRKFEPTRLGSNLFKLTTKQFPIFAEDVRYALGTSDFIEEGGPRRSARTSSAKSAVAGEVHEFVLDRVYRLVPEALQRILQLVSDE